MKAFFDTSTILKLYNEEEGSDELEIYFNNNIDIAILSELADLEFRSALMRKLRMGEIDEEIAINVISCFENDYDNFVWIKLKGEIIKSASTLLMKYGSKGLRYLDAIQLACALTLRDDECIFFTNDNILQEIFYEEGLKLIDLKNEINLNK